MRTMLVAALLAASAAVGTGRASVPFVDVPPCHWAAGAVAELADLGIVIGFPPDDAYLAANAFRQVFEGLRCEDPDWSHRFVVDAPVAFGHTPGTRLLGFSLDAVVLERDAARARLGYELTVVIEHLRERATGLLEGTITVVRDGDGWRVPYAELAALELPVFPD